MNALQIILLAGLLAGTGLALLVTWLLPAVPRAADVTRHYSLGGARERRRRDEVTALSMTDRVGLWTMKQIPDSELWMRTDKADLALLEIPLYRHYGSKLVSGFMGLLIPPLLTYLAAVLGVHVPFVVPLALSFGLAVFLFMAPDITATSKAKAARRDFVRALTAYLDLVALAQQNGITARPALEKSAELGDSWAFRRIADSLQRSSWAGIAAWDALVETSQEFNLPELAELGDIMRLSEEGSEVAALLRERAKALRVTMLKDEVGRTNEARRTMMMPATGLAFVFALILIVPAVLRMIGT